jgi:c-di-GMP-binding flagellar brake protein YcgR
VRGKLPICGLAHARRVLQFEEAMMMEKRRYERIAFSSRVKIMHSVFGDLVVESRDLSHGGIFLVTGDKVTLPVGTDVTIQDQDMGSDAPLVKATIVRVEATGIALMFCDD